MYLRPILRTQLFGTRAAHLNRLQHVCRAEVSEDKTLPSHFYSRFIFLNDSWACWQHLSHGPRWWLWGAHGARPPRGLVHKLFGCMSASSFSSSELWLASCVWCVCLPHRDRCAPKVTRWSWPRRPAGSMAPQLQPSSPKSLIKVSLRISFMRMRR